MKVVSIIGARPQFIKCAPVSRELRAVADEVLVHTGQHYDEAMSGAFFRELGIATPDYHLGVGSGAHGRQTGEMLTGIEKILQKEMPAAVLVYGDTNSTLAGALAAVKIHVPVVHVEAGLRSFNRRMPEEINRVVTDHVSDLLLCPTVTAVENLRQEGITTGVHLVGDVMYDALLDSVDRASHTSTILERLGVEPREYLLATVHRADNTDRLPQLEDIMTAFQILVGSGLTIVFPVHPRTRKQLGKISFAEFRSAVTDRSGALSGDGAPGSHGSGHCDGFRRHTKGSLLAGRSLHHASGGYRVGRNGRERVESSGRNQPGTDCKCNS